MSNRKDENERKRKAKAALKLASAGYIGQQTLRSGVPRALGVRLETHSTGRKQAREILKSGYLDPSKSGQGAVAAITAIDTDVAREKLSNSKGKVFITGSHPTEGVLRNSGPIDRFLGGQLRRSYRGTGNFTPEDWKNVGIFNQAKQESMLLGKTEEFKRISKDPKIAATVRKASTGQLPVVNHLRGKSLYVGGSTKYFTDNFKPDVDVPFAMMSDKKVQVAGSRLGATVQAVKREGLRNLIKNNRTRVGTGAAILGLGGLATQRLIKSAANDLRGKVKPHTRRGRFGITRVRGHKRDV